MQPAKERRLPMTQKMNAGAHHQPAATRVRGIDPFCGCATALVAAEKLALRQWKGNRQCTGLKLRNSSSRAWGRSLGSSVSAPAATTCLCVLTLASCPITGRTSTRCLEAGGALRGVQARFWFRNFTVDHICRSQRAGPTISTTFNCYATPATNEGDQDARGVPGADAGGD